jgi:hypothetical protein
LLLNKKKLIWNIIQRRQTLAVPMLARLRTVFTFTVTGLGKAQTLAVSCP